MKKALIVLCGMILLPLVVFGQNSATKTVDLGDGYQITIPIDWRATKTHDGAFTLATDTIIVSVTTPTRLNALKLTFPANSDIVDVLIGLAAPFNGVQLARNMVQMTRANGRQAAISTNTDDTALDQVYAAVTMSDGSFGYLSFGVIKGQLATLRPTIDAVITSFDGGTSSNAATAESGTEAVVCTLSAEKAKTSQLRVGPGANRGVIGFLPLGVDVTVTGRSVLADGSVWYQLDKTQAAPNGSSAAQLWVAAAQVTTSGACDQVGEASAPPIILRPATATPTPGGANGGESTPESTPPSALPTAGTWVMTMNSTTDGTCAGSDKHSFKTSDIFNPTTSTDRLAARDDSSFRYGTSTFTRVPGSNSFTGTFTYKDGKVGQVRFDVVSPTRMTGQIDGNFEIDGSACSVTAQIVSRHR